MNPIQLLCILAGAAAIALVAPASAHAADYPTRPIEMVVPSSAGGGTDVMARLFADAAKKNVPQPIVVSNKPGAGGGIGMTEAQRAPPDGYKVGVLISELAIIPHLGMTKVTTADFIPIARLNGDPGLIAVRADSPWQSIDELLAAARKQPGAVSMGNAGTGTIWHLAAAAVEQKTGVRFNHVPYQGAAPSVLALVGRPCRRDHREPGRDRLARGGRQGARAGVDGRAAACPRPTTRSPPSRRRASTWCWAPGAAWACRWARRPRWCSSCARPRARRPRTRPSARPW